MAWEVPIGSDEHAALVADALEFLPVDATEMRSMLLARLSVTGARPEAIALTRQRAAEALELAQKVGAPALIAQALAAVNDAFGGPGAHDYAARQRRHHRRARSRVRRPCPRAGGLPVPDRGRPRSRRPGRRRPDIAAFTRLAEQLRQPLMSWYVPLFRGMRSLLAGDLDGADRHHDEVAAAAAATGSGTR